MSEDKSDLREGVEQAAIEVAAGLIGGPEAAAGAAVEPIVEAASGAYDLY